MGFFPGIRDSDFSFWEDQDSRISVFLRNLSWTISKKFRKQIPKFLDRDWLFRVGIRDNPKNRIFLISEVLSPGIFIVSYHVNFLFPGSGFLLNGHKFRASSKIANHKSKRRSNFHIFKKNSLEVLRGQNFKKIVKLRKFPKKGQLYFKMSLLKSAFHKYIKTLPKKFKKIKKSPMPILFSIVCGIQNLYDLFVRRLPDWDFFLTFSVDPC